MKLNFASTSHDPFTHTLNLHTTTTSPPYPYTTPLPPHPTHLPPPPWYMFDTRLSEAELPLVILCISITILLNHKETEPRLSLSIICL